MKSILLLFLLLCCEYTLAQKNSDQQLLRKIDSIFLKYKAKSGAGCAVAIIKDDKVILKRAYGFANIEHKIPITSSTVFPIASVSKQFTGLAISMLIQQQKIALDDDVHQYIPELPDYGKKVTISNLLHHTSGIIDCYEVMTIAGWKWENVFSFDDILKITFRIKELNFEPGTKYAYSNTEYVLLQEIIQRITKKPFRNWTDQNIFKVLGMDNSFFLSDYAELIKNKADHYVPIDGGYKKDLQQISGISMFSTLEDLIKWTIHFNKKLREKDPVYLRMTEDGKLLDGKKVHYGFGLILGNDLGVETVMHTGAWGGYRSVIRNYPKEKLSIIMTSNSGDDDINYVSSFKIASIFLNHLFSEQTTIPIIDTLQNKPTVTLDPAKLSMYVGTYQLGSGAYMISLVNNKLYADYLYQGRQPLEPKTDFSFWVPAYNTSISFQKNQAGEVTAFNIRGTEAKKIAPISPTIDQLKLLTGTYYSSPLMSIYSVEVENGTLMLHHVSRGNFKLSPHPIEPNTFLSDIGSIKFLWKDDQIKVMSIGKIEFERKF